MTTRTPKPAGSQRSWPVPAALIALVVIPVIAGILRLVQLSGGAATLPSNPRFDASPWPVVRLSPPTANRNRAGSAGAASWC